MSTSGGGTTSSPTQPMYAPTGPTGASPAAPTMSGTAPTYAPMAPQPTYTSGNYTTDAYGAAANDMTNASAGATAAMGYQPQQVSYQPVQSTATYQPTSFTDMNMNAYMNPYQDQVIAGAQQDLSNANEQAMNSLGYSATQADAFGGSRHGVAEAQTNQAYLDANAQMLSDLYYQGYDQASGLAMQDANAANQAGAFNAGQTNSMNQFNATNNMNAQMANQSAGLQGANLNLQGSNGLTGTANTGFNQANTIANQQAAYGAQQQATNQALIDQSANMWTGYTAQPGTSLGYTGAAVGSVPYGTTSTSSYNPGLFDYMTLPLAF